MSAESGAARFATSVVGIDGVWPEVPHQWSFSTLVEVEMCPMRWTLSKAFFPQIWARPGYPENPAPAALAGEVVHRAVETIVGRLVATGCTSTGDESAVAVLRSLGGFREVLRRSTRSVLDGLAENPRAIGRMPHYQRLLDQRAPEMRRQAQSLVSRVNLATAQGTEALGTDSRATLHGTNALSDGVYSEFWVSSEALRFKGKIDLLTIAGGQVEITDFKTGEADEHHLEQLRAYELLWLHRDQYKRRDLPVERLTLAYTNREVSVPALCPDEVESMAVSLRSRLGAAEASVMQRPPIAATSESACRYCQVRHLCDSYWSWLNPQQVADGLVDMSVLVTSRNGSKSWNFRTVAEDGLLRADESAPFEAGRSYRLLFVNRRPADEETPSIVSLTSSSEVYELRSAPRA